jgi:hypothetical protein
MYTKVKIKIHIHAYAPTQFICAHTHHLCICVYSRIHMPEIIRMANKHKQQVHKLAFDMGLRHKSSGSGRDRRIAIFKDHGGQQGRAQEYSSEYDEDDDSEPDNLPQYMCARVRCVPAMLACAHFPCICVYTYV